MTAPPFCHAELVSVPIHFYAQFLRIRFFNLDSVATDNKTVFRDKEIACAKGAQVEWVLKQVQHDNLGVQYNDLGNFPDTIGINSAPEHK